jgi:hypothetical protein
MNQTSRRLSVIYQHLGAIASDISQTNPQHTNGMSRKAFVGGNWKCNGTVRPSLALRIASAIVHACNRAGAQLASTAALVTTLNGAPHTGQDIDVVVAPSALHLLGVKVRGNAIPCVPLGVRRTRLETVAFVDGP